MAYNIDHSEYKSGKLYMSPKVARDLLRKNRDGFPCEGCFIQAIAELETDCGPIERFRWSGEGSGSTFDFLKRHVLPLTTGDADILFIWEGGDDMSALKVRNGQVSEGKVVVTIE